MASKSSAIDSVVVDFSGVLVTQTSPVLAELASWHRVPIEALVQVLMGPRAWSTADHPWHRAERGELAAAALQVEVAPYADAAGITLRGDEYARLLTGDFVVNDDVLERIGGLRELGYTVGLLMNSFRELRSTIDGKVDFGMFDVVVDEVRRRGRDIPVIVGGIVPDHDLDELRSAGVAAILTPGATAEQILAETAAVLDRASA